MAGIGYLYPIYRTKHQRGRYRHAQESRPEGEGVAMAAGKGRARTVEAERAQTERTQAWEFDETDSWEPVVPDTWEVPTDQQPIEGELEPGPTESAAWTDAARTEDEWVD